MEVYLFPHAPLMDVTTSLHKDFEQIRKIDDLGTEYWEARALMLLLGYQKWENFEKVVQRAKVACGASNQVIADHFPDVRKMILVAPGTTKETLREVTDYKLSRYACYLIAQNGDPRKIAIAAAQTYFAIQTRKQEMAQSLTGEEKRVKIRHQVKTHNKQLASSASAHGVRHFGKFNNAGYQGLYGLEVATLKKKKAIGKDDILDRAGTTELAANLFRITQTDELLKAHLEQENALGEAGANDTHFTVGRKVRKAIKDIGGTLPEDLPPETHISSVKKKIGKQRTVLLESDSQGLLR